MIDDTPQTINKIDTPLRRVCSYLIIKSEDRTIHRLHTIPIDKIYTPLRRVCSYLIIKSEDRTVQLLQYGNDQDQLKTNRQVQN